MKFETIANLLGDIPYMTKTQGKYIYDIILNNDIHNILELGFYHGTSSCYMAAALEEKGKGQLITIDNQLSLKLQPNIHDLLQKANLGSYVKPIHANRSYNWELAKMLEENMQNGSYVPIFDFCYLDGSHDFEIDSCAFFLLDKLLKPGGMILFDDLTWTYGKSPLLRDADWVKALSPEERDTPHIKKLVELLVLHQPGYSGISVLDDWFLASKAPTGTNGQAVSVNPYIPETSISYDLKKVLHKTYRTLFRKS